MAKRKKAYLEDVHPAAYRPDSLRNLLERYLDWMRTHHAAALSVATRRQDLEGFVAWCEARDVVLLTEVTRELAERYQRHLYAMRKADGKPLAVRSQARRVAALRCMGRWAVRAGVIADNPAAELEAPRCRQSLPANLLTRATAEAVLGLPSAQTPKGLRDRAAMEILYSTGIRRSELINLTPDDIDVERGMLRVREGKGGADRWVAVGERALWWVDRYLLDGRPVLLSGRTSPTLFVTQYGGPFARDSLSNLVRKFLRAAGVQAGCCHVFRHSCATHMLEGGADIRVIQEQLGHRSLATTQVYTRVSNRNLKEVHSRCHPAARLRDEG
jgi:integrase/recombinase XerD